MLLHKSSDIGLALTDGRVPGPLRESNEDVDLFFR